VVIGVLLCLKAENTVWGEAYQAGIRPGTIRTGGGTAKGYKREDFQDPFARYLPQESVTA
jgi:hypothetical protein